MDWLSNYLYAENAANPSEARLWHSSSVGTIHPTDHNSKSSQAWFDGGAHYFGDAEVVNPIGDRSAACLYEHCYHNVESNKL